ncbi:uncharacterized protein LOC107613221 isoform X2 [Arachis ipaensis]|uniref:uncharacterized protein LOC107613221 isoform X2 n=1 Tax=Arachis ipaensis TaxID=130454 RepID=UPI000A2B2E4B|nr:uncharacterized protein LOC107613221 isoform X2 [Arachis ipaensis]
MMSCSLGAPNNKLLNLQFGGRRVGFLQGFGARSWISRKPVQYTTLVMQQQSVKSLTESTAQSIEIQSITRSEDSSEDIHSSGVTSELVPKFHEVEFLLNTICDSSSVGEFELKLDGFHLRVVRGLSEKNKTVPPLTPASTSVNTIPEAPKSNGLASNSALSLAISRPLPSPESIQRFLDKATDEGLVIIQSPKVGFFRRSRTIKGKRTPPACKENQKVEEGQVICFIEQLGGEVPIESDVSGEIIKILRKDGEPVGYGDAVIAVLPSFPGIKIQ